MQLNIPDSSANHRATTPPPSDRPLNIAVVGSGITGLSCAWLLSQPQHNGVQHKVTLFEKDDRLGGHSNTVMVDSKDGCLSVDTGFIVYNPQNYPNLVQLFEHLEVPVQATDMSFSVSMDQGRLEYSGSGLGGLFAQRRNLFRPRFIGMVRDILRFYREAPARLARLDETLTLRELLQAGGYGEAFQREHLLPMGAAIWSTPPDQMLDYPARAFLQFCQNHGLLQLRDRPQWHTVVGGSTSYVDRLSHAIQGKVHTHRAVRSVRRMGGKVLLIDWQNEQWQFDHIVFACHADQTLKLLADPRPEERTVLEAFRFERNRAVLHSDTRLLPRNRKVWASWNYIGQTSDTDQTSNAGQPRIGGQQQLSVSYWMNRLQHLPTRQPMIVTLNPFIEPEPGSVHASFLYDHPLFDRAALAAQQRLWPLQGQHNSWFCGAWCGYGFHEDGLQAGLAVAEALGGVARPWQVAGMYDRLPLPDSWQYGQRIPA